MVIVTLEAPVLGLDSGTCDRTLCTSHEWQEADANPPLPRPQAAGGETHRLVGRPSLRLAGEAVGAQGGWPASAGLARKADRPDARHGSRHGASEANARSPANLQEPGRSTLVPALTPGEHDGEDLPRSRLDDARRPGGPGGDAALPRCALRERLQPARARPGRARGRRADAGLRGRAGPGCAARGALPRLRA